jgi:L-alanine-DL-glutamate epimerase-like enolase superfamily enzyme
MKLTWRRQTLRTRHTWATAKSSLSEKETIVVTLEHEGIRGMGEATPSPLFHQSLEASERALEEMQPLLGDDPFAVHEIVARLIEHCDASRDAIAAVENALHDWIGRRLNMPVWRWLGLPEPRVYTTFTIGIAEPAEVREKVKEAVAAGFDRLKIKVGSDHDEQTLSIIRESFDGPLFLDANQAWSRETAPVRIRALAAFKPVMIEQPLPLQDIEGLRPLRELGVCPIFADEACQRPVDVIRLRNAVDGVNIKFNKCGGIREALAMISIARACDLKIMLGCFVSSSLAIAPALAVARLVDYVDLDGALLLADDPFASLVRHQRGLLTAAPGPGFGGS